MVNYKIKIFYSPNSIEASVGERRHRELPYHRHIGLDGILLERGRSGRNQVPLLPFRIAADRKSHYVVNVVGALRLQALGVVLVQVAATLVHALARSTTTAAEGYRD